MGRPIDRDTKAVIYNVAKYFLKRKAKKTTYEFKNDINIAKTVAEATGYSERTVRNVIKEGNASPDTLGPLKFRSPIKSKGKKKIPVNDAQLAIINKKVHQFYEADKKMPSVRKLLLSLKEDGDLKCGREYLRKLLHQLGYQLNEPKTKKKPKKAGVETMVTNESVDHVNPETGNYLAGVVSVLQQPQGVFTAPPQQMPMPHQLVPTLAPRPQPLPPPQPPFHILHPHLQ